MLRTSQSYFPFLKSAKDRFYLHARRLARLPHDRDLACIRHIDFRDRVIVDVGANHGQSIESCRLYRRDVAIHSFEPNPMLAEMLRRRYAGCGGVTVHGVGLADRSDVFDLYVPSYRGFVYDGLASMDVREASEWLSPETIYGFSRDALSINRLSCRVETLDAQGLKPAFIKIDVQGFELQVLKGAAETLNAFRPVLLIEAVPPEGEIVRFLRGLGYVECAVRDGAIVPGSVGGKNALYAVP
ncbi:FkbM family methyltransferase [Methylobacterium sp. ID0610]|uniref:FkbM family methyltransferase n=1 Tax=Methylobacterium carpenticola TaxID=3344827 RepID=UPI00368F3BEC